jgi:CelD/BcsL family acetyltransferase involved in cellulose biosynthesis
VSTYQITLITQFEDLLAISNDWDRLMDAARMDNIFLTSDWLCEWWRHYGFDRELWVLIAKRNQSLCGIAPLMIERTRNGQRRIVFFGTGEVVPNHLDFITLPEMRIDLINRFCEYIIQFHRQWDLLDLDGFPSDSPSLDVIISFLYKKALRMRTKLSERCPYIVLPSSYEKYLRSRGSVTRAQLRRKMRRLMRDFPEASFGRVEQESELDEVFDSLVRLHQARWVRRGKSGAFANPGFISFHRSVAHQGLLRGQLRMYYLKHEGSYVAIYYCFRVGQRVMYYNAGFDERWGKYSVGTQLLAYAIEQSIAEGAREFDFLQGDESYNIGQHTYVTIGVYTPPVLTAVDNWLGLVYSSMIRFEPVLASFSPHY